MADAPDAGPHAAPEPETVREQVPPPRRPGIPGPEATAWERRAEVGWWTAYKNTMVAVATDPVGFFGGLDPRVERYDGAILHMTHQTVVMAVAALFQILFLGAMFGLLQNQSGAPPGFQLPALLGVQGGTACGLVLLGPWLALLFIVLYACCIHGALLTLGYAKHGFGQTVRGTAYAFCPYVLAIIPLGDWVAFVWTIALVAVFVKEFHGAPLWAAMVAAAWPSALFCCAMLVALGVGVGLLVAQ